MTPQEYEEREARLVNIYKTFPVLVLSLSIGLLFVAFATLDLTLWLKTSLVATLCFFALSGLGILSEIGTVKIFALAKELKTGEKEEETWVNDWE